MSSPFIASFALFIQIAGFRCCCEEWESIPLKWWVAKLRNESAQLLRRTETPERYPRGRTLSCRCVAAHPGCEHRVADVRRARLVAAQHCDFARHRFCSGAHFQLGFRANSARFEARRRRAARAIDRDANGPPLDSPDHRGASASAWIVRSHTVSAKLA